MLRWGPPANPPPPLARLAITDQAANTQRAVGELGQVPGKIFKRVRSFMAGSTDGGISVGDKPITQLPGGSGLTGTPRGWPAGSTWDNVAGVYMPASRRLLINSGGASASVPLHEFGHAADHAYGNLSGQQDFANVEQQVKSAVGTSPNWNSYYNHPSELWAEGFAAWTRGGNALRNLTAGDANAAQIMKDYFDRIF